MENGTTISLSPYLGFNGNCREAMNFYQNAIGGELEFHTFEGMPTEVPEEYKERIMHASLRSGNLSLMASDSLPGQSPEIINGNSVSISIWTGDLASADNLFTSLSEGGTVTMPFQPVFWGGTFGMLTDKFGIDWMVSCEEVAEQVEKA
ncbi:MAG: VOC family protein [Candidatus Kapaibacterium sp.]